MDAPGRQGLEHRSGPGHPLLPPRGRGRQGLSAPPEHAPLAEPGIHAWRAPEGSGIEVQPGSAGETDAHHSASLEREHDHDLFTFVLAGLGVGPSEEIDVWRGALHMHLLGARARLSVDDGGGGEDCLVQISAANQPIVDGEPKQPETVGWGDGTFDEMCLGIIYVARK